MAKRAPTPDKTLVEEARVFSRYLVHAEPPKEVVHLYCDIISSAQDVSHVDARLLTFIRQHPVAVGWIDGGLALVRPYSEVRRRIYYMLAALEARPEFCRLFLPQERSWWYLFVIVWHGSVGLVQTLVGAILVKVIGR